MCDHAQCDMSVFYYLLYSKQCGSDTITLYTATERTFEHVPAQAAPSLVNQQKQLPQTVTLIKVLSGKPFELKTKLPVLKTEFEIIQQRNPPTAAYGLNILHYQIVDVCQMCSISYFLSHPVK